MGSKKNDVGQIEEVGQEVDIYKNELSTVPEIVEEETQEEKDLREKTKKYTEAADIAYLNLAGCLYDIRKKNTFHKWGFPTFTEYVEKELKSSVRKAEYLIKVWDYYVIGLGNGTDSFLKKVQHIGFTKLKECVDVLKPDNVDTVLKQVEGMSTRKIIDMKKHLAVQDELKDKKSDNTKTGDEMEIDNEKSNKKHSMSFKFFSEQYKAVHDALELAGKSGNTENKNTQIVYICSSFLEEDMSKDPEKNRMQMCALLEKRIGVKIVAFDEKSKSLLYGKEVIKSIIESEM